jgi:4-methyl-5(b-hydroxyethyl)-thiazole monophosphate biosynthesis
VEEIEAVAALDILRRADLRVLSAAVGESATVRGAHGISLGADILFKNVAAEEFDGLILPGGPASFGLRGNMALRELVQKMQKKFLAAICAAPLILLDAGVLEGRRHTAYPSLSELPLAEPVAVVADGNLITGRGPAAAIPFALAIVRHFAGKDRAERIAQALCAVNPGQTPS